MRRRVQARCTKPGEHSLCCLPPFGKPSLSKVFNDFKLSFKVSMSQKVHVPLLLAICLFLASATVSATHTSGGTGTFGSFVKDGDTDFTVSLKELPSTQHPWLAIVEAGTGGVDSDDCYYIHLDDSVSPDDTPNHDDIAIADGHTSCENVGTLIRSTDIPGTYDSVTLDLISLVRYMEVDGQSGFTEDDWVYFDTGDDAGELDDGDIRLRTPRVGSITPPTSTQYVLPGDADLASTTTGEDVLPYDAAFEPGAFSWRYFDANVDGEFDDGDDLVLIPPGGSTDFLSVHHVFLGDTGRSGHGDRVEAGDRDAVPLLKDLTGDVYIATTTDLSPCPDLLEVDFYLHFGDPGGGTAHIQPGDITLRRDGGTDGRASNYWRKVGTTTDGAGSPITASKLLNATDLYYVNKPGTPATFTGDDWLYLNIDDTFCGDAGLGYSEGDIRIKGFSYSGQDTYSAGSMVRTSDDDLDVFDSATLNPNSHTEPWAFLLHDADGSSSRPLKSLTKAAFNDTDDDGIWDSTEAVYIDADGSGNVTAGDTRLRHTSLTASTTDDEEFVGSGDGDIGSDLATTSSTRFYLLGSTDTTFHDGAGEWVIYSPDAHATPGDRAVTAVGAIAAGDALTAAQTDFDGIVGSVDDYFFQWVPDGQTGPYEFAQVHDLRMGSSPDPVQESDREHVPVLQRIDEGDQFLVHLDREEDSLLDDTFYLALRDGAFDDELDDDDLRLTPFIGGDAAGTLVQLSDTLETSASSSLIFNASDLSQYIRFVDLDGDGFDPTDPVYIDLPTSLGGDTFGNISRFDIRLTQQTVDGVTFKAGTMIRSGDEDLNEHSGAYDTLDAGFAFELYYWDSDRDGEFDEDDKLYVVVEETASPRDPMTPDLLTLRLTGSGGGSSNTGSGSSSSGGGSSSSSGSGSSSSSGSDSGGDSSTSTPPPTSGKPDLRSINIAINQGLTVTRDANGNHLAWPAQSGIDGYQVWRSASPYQYVHLARGADNNHWTDSVGKASSHYLVTAYYRDGDTLVGFTQDLHGEGVPGGSALVGIKPTPAAGGGTDSGATGGGASDGDGGTGDDGSGSGGDEDEPTPGLAVVSLIAVLGGALVLARRRSHS